MTLIDIDDLGVGRCSKDILPAAYCAGWNGLLGLIEKAPTVDAVPVVRCKDCKWFADNNDGEWYGCQMFHVVQVTPEDAPKPDDYCSYGERKNGGADHGA